MATWPLLRRLGVRLLAVRPFAPRRHAAALVTSTPPDEALLRTIAVLRALGGRITRYDSGESSLEARLARRRGQGTIRVCATAHGAGSRICIESDAPGWRATRALLARELASTEERDR